MFLISLVVAIAAICTTNAAEEVIKCPGGECVKLHLCLDGTFNFFGENLIDIRFNPDDPCEHYLLKCCVLPEEPREPEDKIPPGIDTNLPDASNPQTHEDIKKDGVEQHPDQDKKDPSHPPHAENKPADSGSQTYVSKPDENPPERIPGDNGHPNVPDVNDKDFAKPPSSENQHRPGEPIPGDNAYPNVPDVNDKDLAKPPSSENQHRPGEPADPNTSSSEHISKGNEHSGSLDANHGDKVEEPFVDDNGPPGKDNLPGQNASGGGGSDHDRKTPPLPSGGSGSNNNNSDEKSQPPKDCSQCPCKACAGIDGPKIVDKHESITTTQHPIVTIVQATVPSGNKTTNSLEADRGLTTQNPLEFENPGCGVRHPGGVGFRITGNSEGEAEYGEFPWMVAILKEEKALDNVINVYQCGGSLIHPQVVLTAAHCVQNKQPSEIKIRLGEWDTQTTNEIYEHQDRNVQSITVHKEFYKGGLFNDVALLFLDRAADLQETVNTVCLPPQNTNFDLSRCFAAGWGKNVFGKEGKYQVILKKIELPVVPHGKCQDALRTTRLSRRFILHTSFMCAGGEIGKDTCKGDGGSPLVCPVPHSPGRYYQAGIVAWGIGCGDEGIPGVYANVALFKNWIDEQLAQHRIPNTFYTIQ